MSVRSKTTKELAARINPLYVRQSWWTRWRVRILVALPAVLAVAAWLYMFFKMPEKARATLNPGPVSVAHGLWETKCYTCHENDEHGKFRADVTDAACLKCHNAPLHHPNQLMRTGANADNPLALAVEEKNGTKRAAHCTACHIEHKGHDRLTAVADITCTQCHENIKKAAPANAKLTTANASNFDNKGGHPTFGSALTPANIPVPASRTPAFFHSSTLRFTHGRPDHNKLVLPAGKMENCIQCHVPAEGPPSSISSSTGDTLRRPPMAFATEARYARDCKECHEIITGGGLPIPHESFESIKRRLKNPAELYRAWIIAQPPDKKENLTGDKNPTEEQIKGFVTDKVGSDTSKDDAAKWFAARAWMEQKGPDGKLLPDAQVLENLSHRTGPEVVLSLYIAFEGQNRCIKCHDLADPGVYSAASSRPATAPALAANLAVAEDRPLLRTIPSPIDAPRRWYPRSGFDHRPHQNVTCQSCHYGFSVRAGRTDSDMRDLVEPNLNWIQPNGIASCVDCHHPSTTGNRGARATCVTCHNFHNHQTTTAPPNPEIWDGAAKKFVANKPSTQPAPQ